MFFRDAFLFKFEEKWFEEFLKEKREKRKDEMKRRNKWTMKQGGCNATKGYTRII